VRKKENKSYNTIIGRWNIRRYIIGAHAGRKRLTAAGTDLDVDDPVELYNVSKIIACNEIAALIT